MRPLVVVTGADKRFAAGWWSTRLQLALVGLRAWHVTPANPELPEQVSGFIIGGGDDIDPEHYGESGDAGATYDKHRDALEMEIVGRALDRRLPLLGICRGAQLINVFMKGSLHADLRPQRVRTPNRNSVFPIKAVNLDPGSRLADIYQVNRLRVNSLHNQAVNRVADTLRDVAWDADNFIQAVEFRQPEFVIGVQWHPEYMLWSFRQRLLFRAFAEAVRVYSGQRRW